MLELKPKRLLSLGLFVVLSTYNLAYANTSVTGNTTASPVKEQPSKLTEVGSNTSPANNSIPTTAPATKKTASSGKPSASAVKGCACSCAATKGRTAGSNGSVWSCIAGCLRSWGVSVVQFSICAGTCAFGIIPLCAICVGVDVSIVMLCSIGCGVYAGTHTPIEDDHMPYQVRKPQRKSGRYAQHRVLAFASQQ